MLTLHNNEIWAQIATSALEVYGVKITSAVPEDLYHGKKKF